MKQITQKELIELIEEKQENAKNMFYETRDNEKDFGKAELKKARCLAEMDAYQDLICYLNSVEIVPEAKQEEKKCECYDPIYKRCNGTRERDECYCNGDQNKCTHYPKKRIVTTIPKAKQEELGITQEDLRDMIEKTPITPYNEPKVEPLRNEDDRIREFEILLADMLNDKSKGSCTIDAKEIVLIGKPKKDIIEIIFSSGTVIHLKKSKYNYKELVEWWKYWKQN